LKITDYALQDFILATAILHNIAIRWNAEQFDEEEDRGGDAGYWEAGHVEIILEEWYCPHLDGGDRLVEEKLVAELHLAPGGDPVVAELPGDVSRRQYLQNTCEGDASLLHATTVRPMLLDQYIPFVFNASITCAIAAF